MYNYIFMIVAATTRAIELLHTNLDEALCVNQYIAWLEITMDNIAWMYILDNTEQLKRKIRVASLIFFKEMIEWMWKAKSNR